jgi:hypothetical protein
MPFNMSSVALIDLLEVPDGHPKLLHLLAPILNHAV